MIADFVPRLIRSIPARLRPVVVTAVLGLAAGLAAVLFQLSITFIYQHGLETLTHYSRTTFLVGSFLLVAATSAMAGVEVRLK